MEGGMELEDDLFFADLSKQISLLIMDEDEDSHTSCRPNSIQVFHLHIFDTPHNYAFDAVTQFRSAN
jgi:hypothetical protein